MDQIMSGQGSRCKRSITCAPRTEPGNQVLVEHPDYDPRRRVQPTHQHRRRDVHEIVARDNDDPAGVLDPGRLQHLGVAAIAFHSSGTVKARVVW